MTTVAVVPAAELIIFLQTDKLIIDSVPLAGGQLETDEPNSSVGVS